MAGLLNGECRPYEAQMPNRSLGLLVNNAGDGPLCLLDLEIVLRDALTVNRAVSRRAPLLANVIRAAAVTGHTVNEEVANSGLRS